MLTAPEVEVDVSQVNDIEIKVTNFGNNADGYYARISDDVTLWKKTTSGDHAQNSTYTRRTGIGGGYEYVKVAGLDCVYDASEPVYIVLIQYLFLLLKF